MNKLIEWIQHLGRTPVVPLAGFPGIPLTKKTIKENLKDENVQLKSLLALNDVLKPDAIFTMMDLTVEAEFLGCDLKFEENQPPAVYSHPLQNEEDIESVFSQKKIGGRQKVFAKVIKGLKEEVNVPIGCYVIGPFTLAGELMKQAKALKAVKKNPEFLHKVLDKCRDIVLSYSNYLVSAGADILCILEPSAMMLSPKQFMEFSGNYCKDIFDKNEEAISVLHICGNTEVLLKEMEKVGCEGLSLDTDVNFVEASKVIKNSVLIGNLNPVGLLTQSSKEKVIEETQRLMDEMKDIEGFILSSGCDIPENAPMENLIAMMQFRERVDIL